MVIRSIAKLFIIQHKPKIKVYSVHEVNVNINLLNALLLYSNVFSMGGVNVWNRKSFYVYPYIVF